mgnify:CR=1 FL=1
MGGRSWESVGGDGSGLAGVLFARASTAGLMVTFGLMLAGLLVWLGGGYILDGKGLAWRSWVNTVCLVGGVLLFLVFMGLTISCLHRWSGILPWRRRWVFAPSLSS